MKNLKIRDIITLLNNCRCWSCHTYGFFIETPDGGEYTTCPFCGDEADVINEEDKYDDQILICKKCCIPFDFGCVHAIGGCTDNTSNAHVPSKWIYDGQTYVGAPQLEFEECATQWAKITVLEWACLNSGKQCMDCAYPPYRSPEYYRKCDLVKK